MGRIQKINLGGPPTFSNGTLGRYISQNVHPTLNNNNNNNNNNVKTSQ